MRKRLELVSASIPDVQVISVEDALHFYQTYKTHSLTILDERYLGYINSRISNGDFISKKTEIKTEIVPPFFLKSSYSKS